MSVELQGSIAPLIERARQEARRMVISFFKAVGEQCTEEAVANGSYTDNTGNLRGSIGYAICENGRVIYYGGFQQVKNGVEGPKEGLGLASELASQTKEMTLFIVAGMSYASYVADKGYNVLDSAELLADRLIKQLK